MNTASDMLRAKAPGQAAEKVAAFVDASPTAFHAVDTIAAALEASGAQALNEAALWRLEPGAAYFVRRGGSGLIAFRPGLRRAREAGFMLAGAHTDSPGLKLRLEKPLQSRNYVRAPVEVYGGAILSGWLDRPLALAGRVAVLQPEEASAGAPVERLFNSGHPVGIIPNLAIHLNREINKGFEYNPHQHLPLLVDALPLRDAPADGRAYSWAQLYVAEALAVPPDTILGADLFFVESQKTCVLHTDAGGLINGPRLDNLAGCQAILEAFVASAPTAQGQVACFMDAEEVGSQTAQGADSSFLRDVLARICIAEGARPDEDGQAFYCALAKSFCISVDGAQAWHPAYPEKFDEAYAPCLNGGIALKSGANWRYATDASAEARFRLLCATQNLRCQKYMSRPDIAPGTTIGPITAAHLGIPTVDIGHPLLAMHAIRETIGMHDHVDMITVLGQAFSAAP